MSLLVLFVALKHSVQHVPHWLEQLPDDCSLRALGGTTHVLHLSTARRVRCSLVGGAAAQLQPGIFPRWGSLPRCDIFRCGQEGLVSLPNCTKDEMPMQRDACLSRRQSVPQVKGMRTPTAAAPHRAACPGLWRQPHCRAVAPTSLQVRCSGSTPQAQVSILHVYINPETVGDHCCSWTTYSPAIIAHTSNSPRQGVRVFPLSLIKPPVCLLPFRPTLSYRRSASLLSRSSLPSLALFPPLGTHAQKWRHSSLTASTCSRRRRHNAHGRLTLRVCRNRRKQNQRHALMHACSPSEARCSTESVTGDRV
eukprot:366528-Chlamydomonas_euryale.AAC.13